ncbi:Uncharacterized beta-barrel protein YwiB, DUF1934 family [Evansella caseinilytica]|uniref:Uncharacterized beta-barrel protein YwiB, DUF1934 family n=1 Tax=Evansella caseinilytica TaxID=1503961 RepID=A0A1H3T418_9BACI|nr:DUF1934 domain-containing protein [Evansella caseinilytica]SDZ44628.1 Uncharacterized beta-barrel protein YwiB, DUF1934 family [Evansella caseinilytica]
MDGIGGTPVTIHMKTTVYHGGNHEETNAISTDGQLFTQGQTTYLRFQEPPEMNGSQDKSAASVTAPPTIQLIKIRQGEISVSRKGAVSMKQRFIPGLSTEGMYHSPHGPLAMKTKTKSLEFIRDTERSTWTLQLRYTLHLQEVYAGEFDIRITIKKV